MNWADFPEIAVFDDGTLIISWLKENAALAYANCINLALSDDGGQNWGDAITPHTDRSARQHGFMTLFVTGPDSIIAFLLDAYGYDKQNEDDSFGNAMQLRSTTIGRDIYVVCRSGKTWSEPVPVHGDGWEISGCPVNGPSIDAYIIMLHGHGR